MTPCQSVGGQAECDETQRLLDLREAQLADCTRAMREVAESVRATADDLQTRDYSDAATEAAAKLHEAAQKLSDARAKKVGG